MGFFELIKLINRLWDAILEAIGYVKAKQHEAANKEIAQEAQKAGNPAVPEEERREATKSLEDRLNRNA